MRFTLPTCCEIRGATSGLFFVKSGLGQAQRNSSFAYSSVNIHLHKSTLLLVICRQFNARYTPHMLPNTWYDIRFALCQLWSRLRPAYFQFCIFRLQSTIERSSVAIGHMSAFRCALYFTFAAKYRERDPV